MSRHGTPLRGLMSASRSPLFQGRFGRMFRGLPQATYGATDAATEANLTSLAVAMKGADDPPKDGKDDEESGIPALYTYLGQFIDHDLTFDPSSSLQKQNDPNGLTDFRTPAFDLDCVYGRGPDDQPYLYDTGKAFALGAPLGGGRAGATDLPRNETNGRALIGDPRNDENTIVSQFQGLLLRFHNRALRDTGATFAEVQQIVRFHYQYVILHDFLPRVVDAHVLSALKSGGHFDRHKLEFFHWRNDPFMPVEFSGAAYRFGHSMVRPGYRLNDGETLLAIFPGLSGFQPVGAGRGIDWGRFIDVDVRAYDGGDPEKKKRLQFAYRIDTSIVEPLSKLPPVVAAGGPIALAERNLKRGFRLGLPSGQAVARAMGVRPLTDEEILIGTAVDKPDAPLGNILQVKGADRKVFAGNCPLWTYILAEAMHHKAAIAIPVKEKVGPINTPRLGPVGGRIVAEVFLGLMFGDDNSLLRLDRNWHPAGGADYRLKDFVKYALGD